MFDTDTDAVVQFLLLAGVAAVLTLLLVVASASVLSRKRQDRPGVLRVLAGADLLFGIGYLGLTFLTALSPVLMPVLLVILAVAAFALLFLGWRLWQKASTPPRKENDSSSEAGFWEQFD